MGEQGGEAIVVRGRGRGDGRGRGRRRGGGEGHGSDGWWLEFHKVDLKQGKVEMNCYPKMHTWTRSGTMFLVGPKLCVAGRMREDGKVECASLLDLEENEWKHTPLPVKDGTSPDYNSLDGKIYHYDHRPRYADDLDLFEFIWSHLGPRDPGIKLVPDPANKRMLLNLHRGDLYAYYPSHRRLELVGRNVGTWSNVVVVAGNIAYVHFPEPECCHRLLDAFDLSNGGKQLECVWTSTTVDGFNFASLGVFDGLFHVPNTTNFWLATWNPDRGSTSLRLYFIKFEAIRTVDDRIICTPLAFRSSLLENTSLVYDFLLLQSTTLTQWRLAVDPINVISSRFRPWSTRVHSIPLLDDRHVDVLGVHGQNYCLPLANTSTCRSSRRGCCAPGCSMDRTIRSL
ncbi:hypothetical protein OROGR_012416 [Orobanche gracilis]